MNDNYDDIINFNYPPSSHKAKMSLYQRAAQFAPFAALTGHDEAIYETARITSKKLPIDESYTLDLDMKIDSLRTRINERPKVSLIYFIPDKKKKGGKYVEIVSHIKDIDNFHNEIVLSDNKRISVNDIFDIKLFENPNKL